MRYPVVLLDLDHTLIDSDAAQDAAFAEALAAGGVHGGDGAYERFMAVNAPLWAAVERHEITPDDVRYERFRRLVAAEGWSADPERMADAFTDGLVVHARFFPGAEAMLDRLAPMARLGLVTNGLSDVQRGRVDRLGLGRWLDATVISAEVGVAKPAPEIFELAFELLGSPPKDGALMVGDSLSSDIPGGAAFGIDTCWYDRTGAGARDGVAPTHRITALEQLPGLVEHGVVG